MITITQLTRPLVLIVDGDTNRSYTFNDIKLKALTFGRGLIHQFQWQKGDVLGFYTPNHIDIPSVNFGLIWAGGVASPANPTYTPEELARQLKDSNAKALVTQMPLLQTAFKAADLAGLARDRVILLGDSKDDEGVTKHWSDITDQGAWLSPKRPKIDPKKDLAYLVYSSVSEMVETGRLRVM